MQTLKLKWNDVIGSTSGRVMLILIAFKVILIVGFLIFTYTNQIEYFRNVEIAKLKSISNSLAIQIDGDQHAELFRKYPNVDDIASNTTSAFYEKIHSILKRTKEVNGLKTDIYTLVPNADTTVFEFGISSSDQPFFRHEWTQFNSNHIQNYLKGAVMGPYSDENGVWLSSFTPIQNKAGKTVAIIQVDDPFGPFIAKANVSARNTLFVMIAILAVLVYIMLHFVQRLLIKDDKLKRTLKNQRNAIEIKNKEIVSSIARAKTIQDALLPSLDKIQATFPEMFVMFQPRDIVSGDFFWFAEKEDFVFFAVADCTGHGVPGGFMSMIGHAILADLIHQPDISTPADLLKCLDRELTNMLQENGKCSADGMDIAIIRFCPKTTDVQFAGALRPIIKISERKIEKISGDKFSIGGINQREKIFTNHTISVNPGDNLYLFSDGYSDQFGGRSDKKYMSKRFAEFLVFAQEHEMEDQKYLLQYEFHDWKSEVEQIDDVLVAGIKIPSAA